MRIINFLFFFGLILFSTNSYSADNNCKLLGDNLYNCVPYECNTPWPADNKKIVNNKITGYNDKKECVHVQTNPNGDKITCKYSEESRKYLSLRMKKASSDLLHMPEGSEMEENMLADIFQNECEVVNNSGVKESADSEPADSSEEESQQQTQKLQENYEESPDVNNDESSQNPVSMDDDSSESDKSSAVPADIDENSDLTQSPMAGKNDAQ